jgi:hypothetical protein
MPRRTTILLDEDIYHKVVNESLRRHKTTKAMPRVANELLEGALKGETKILDLVFSEKLAETSGPEFEAFRRGLSRRLEF